MHRLSETVTVTWDPQNAHSDLVAALAANGTVSTSLHLDPWSVPLRPVPAGSPTLGLRKPSAAM